MNRTGCIAVLVAMALAPALVSADPMRPSDFVPQVVQTAAASAGDREFRLFGLMRRGEGWRANVNNKWLGVGDEIGGARVQRVTPELVVLQSPERGRIELAIKKKDIKRVAN